MSVKTTLDEIEELLAAAWKIPMTNGKCAVATEEIRTLIDEIRLSLPKELKQSQLIVSDRNNILLDAKQNAKNIVDAAKKQAQHLLEEEEIIKQARKQASKILMNARVQANELQKKTNKYVMELLGKVELELNRNSQSFKTAFNEIKNIIKKI